MLNWAWLVETDDGFWEQFDCLNCMALEAQWSLWKEDKTIVIDLDVGTIKFATMTTEKKK